MQIKPIMEELFPICRSITGDGFKESLDIISRELPLNILEYPSGQECYEWTVPDEWNIQDAYIKDQKGNRVVDFQESSLHVVSYSTPVKKRMSFDELKDHLFYLPKQPTAIPYRTSYYQRTWGFCLSYDQYLKMEKDPTAEYDVCIDSEIKKGVMRIGEWFLPGETDQEIIFSTYNCHPSQANDGLSSTLVAVAVAKKIQQWAKRRFSYRLLILPGTIGSITYLHDRQDQVKKIYGGYVFACLGDPGKFNYKKTYQGNHEVDKAMICALKKEGVDFVARDFWPWGGDEGQFASPGFRIPVGSLMRSPYMEFPEYHTSLDNLDFVTEEALQGSVNAYSRALQNIEMNGYYKVLIKGEPKLDKYNMYVGYNQDRDRYAGIYYFFSMSDGQNSLLDIHDKCGVDMEILYDVAEKARINGLVERV